MSSQEGPPKRRKKSSSSTDTSSQNTQDLDQPLPPRQQENAPQQSALHSWLQFIVQCIAGYYIIMLVFKGNQTPPAPPADINFESTTRSGLPTASQLIQLWPQNSNMDLRVYISENENFDRFDDQNALVWHTPNVQFGDWKDEREKALEIETSVNVQYNGTLYAHIYLTLERATPNPHDPAFQSNMRVYQRKLLTRYLPKRKEIKTKKLLGAESSEKETLDSVSEESITKEAPIVSHWYPNLTLNIVSDNVVVPYSQLPDMIKSEIPLEHHGKRDVSRTYGYYLPIVYVNDFWMLREHMSPINETVKTLPLNLKYYPISFLKFQMYVQMGESFRSQAELVGGNGQSELDEVKRMLLETNPILLGVTFTVSILHSVFEFLAFKNDIADWKNKKELTGISVRTILMNIFFQLVIFLYLFDNNETTSWMILLGQGIGLIIEIWKIKKAVSVEIKSATGKYFPYSIRFVDKHVLSESEKKTKEYDRLAFSYLSWIAFPLLLLYSVYSLIYETHKSWYSFVVTTLVGYVYAFGFIMMTPQLFINYKLKSVAHMPWKALMYKTLGTFVDDLFSFCIKMPTLHRLACLRDDVVFFVYIYQRWIYPVDKKRVNEYGQVGDAGEQTLPDEPKKEK